MPQVYHLSERVYVEKSRNKDVSRFKVLVLTPCLIARAAVTETARLWGLSTTDVYFSWSWRLEA